MDLLQVYMHVCGSLNENGPIFGLPFMELFGKEAISSQLSLLHIMSQDVSSQVLLQSHVCLLPVVLPDMWLHVLTLRNYEPK